MIINGISHSLKNNINFNSRITQIDGKVAYNFDIDDRTGDLLKIEKTVNAKPVSTNEKLLKFIHAVYNIGLLPDFLKIYKNHQYSNLPQISSGITQKLSLDNLAEFIRLSNTADYKTLNQFLSKDLIVLGIQNGAKNQLTIGKIKKLDEKTINKINNHILTLGISHSSGGISGQHVDSIYNFLFKIASEYKNRIIEIDGLSNVLGENINSINIRMDSENPDKLFVNLKSLDGLYKVKLPPIKDDYEYLVQKYFIRTKTDNGKYRFSLHEAVAIEENSIVGDDIRKSFIKLSNYPLNKKFYCDANYKISNRHNIFNLKSISLEMPNRDTIIYTHNFADNKKFTITITKINHDGKTLYIADKEEDFTQILEDFAGNDPKKKICLDAIKSGPVDTIDLGYHFISPKDDKLNIDYISETYCLEKEKITDDLSVIKYKYRDEPDKTKTIASGEIIKKVLDYISNNDFDTAYKIDKSGKIFAYMQINNIYFKLILTKSATPTLFPITKNDLQNEIGNIPDNIPSYNL